MDTTEKTEVEKKEPEVDPLDAFMMEVNKDVRQQMGSRKPSENQLVLLIFQILIIVYLK